MTDDEHETETAETAETAGTGETEETEETGEGEGEASERQPYHHGDLRAALIRAGLAILAEEGARALTLRAVARRAGVSHNAPYRHFADKDALLAAIAEEGFLELAARMEAAQAQQARQASGTRSPQSPQAQLEESGWTYVQFALAHPDHLRVMFGTPFANMRAYPGLLAAGARAFTTLVEIIQAGQACGEIIAGNPRQLAVTAWGMVHGLALLLANQQIPPDVRAAQSQEALVRLCLRQHVHGLAPRA